MDLGEIFTLLDGDSDKVKDIHTEKTLLEAAMLAVKSPVSRTISRETWDALGLLLMALYSEASQIGANFRAVDFAESLIRDVND